MTSKRIVVVGSSNTDMVVKSAFLPGPGETVTGGTFLLAPGGKGANQAVAAARLGGDVTFIAKVGEDTFGHEAIEGYRKEKIDTDWIGREKGHATGIALILVDEKGENLISVAPGANFRWSDDDIRRVQAVIESAGIVVMQLEIPLQMVVAVAKIAAEAGVPVMLDPAPAQKLPEELLKNISVLKPNRQEAALVSGVETDDRDSAIRAAGRLLEMGVRDAVIITLGAEGSLLCRRGFEPEIIAAPTVKAVDTTAAGDAFSGALAFQLSRGVPLPEAIRFSNHVAALSATGMGAQPSLPTLSQVEAFMKR